MEINIKNFFKFNLQSYEIFVKDNKILKSKSKCCFKSNRYNKVLLWDKELNSNDIFHAVFGYRDVIENGLYYVSILFYKTHLSEDECGKMSGETCWDINQVEYFKLENNE